MVLAHGIDKKVGICDIECYHELFDVGCYNPDTKEWVEFEVSFWKNELYEFVKWYTSKPFDYLVTFNGIGYDQQVMQYVVDNHQSWFDLTNLEIVKKISEYSTKVIEDSKYNIAHRYKEHHFSIFPIDVFRIMHFDNKAKRTSLKWCEYMMNMDVEEMPVPFYKKDLTQEDIVGTMRYNRHDIMATLGLLYVVLGDIQKIKEINGGNPVDELMDYEGKNAIEVRLEYIKETGLQCLNWSDVKIGEEWNKLEYMRSEGIKDEKLLFPPKIKQPFGQKFKNFFPKTMAFKTQHMINFMEYLGKQLVRDEDQEFPVTLGETTYTIAKGGIHSTEKYRKLTIPPKWKARDGDVGAQYPNSIIKLDIFPPHLKRTIIVNFVGTVEMKDKYKQMGKDAKDKAEKARLKGLEGGTKLRMNGGYYGKLGQEGSFLYYPEGLLKVCMSNQIEILMLVEMLEMEGIKVVSGNTDGIVALFPEEKESDYIRICGEWEKAVGNDKMGKLEYADFLGWWQDNINSYIAKTLDDKGNIKIKKKGKFVTTYGSPGCEINKNKSARVISLALEAYFIDGKDPVEFINNHKNIFDFTIAVKSTEGLYYEEQWEVDGKVHVKRHKKLVVYYVSNEGTVLWKRGINSKGNPMNNQCNAPKGQLSQPLITYFNTIQYKKDYNINYDFYIIKTLKRIDMIEKSKKMDSYIKSKMNKQLSLF